MESLSQRLTQIPNANTPQEALISERFKEFEKTQVPFEEPAVAEVQTISPFMKDMQTLEELADEDPMLADALREVAKWARESVDVLELRPITPSQEHMNKAPQVLNDYLS